MGSDITPATEASAISLNDYISFTLTPANGVSLAYTLLSFALNVNNGGDDITANISVRWNVDAFATALVTKTRLVLSGNSTTSGSAVTLSSFPAQSIPVEFRFYFFDDQDNAFTTVGIDSITLTGTVVPEPSSFALLVLGWFCFARLTSIRRSTRN